MRSPRAGSVLLATLLALPAAWAQAPRAAAATAVRATGEIFGLVTDAAGRREAGALVEVRGQGLHGAALRRLTSAQGIFTLAGLKPGTYYVQVGKGARVAERRRVVVHASERALLLVNLPQLLSSVRFGPPAGVQPDQAFAWALRQATIWRPVLRLDRAAEAEREAGPPVEGYVALTAGAGTGAFAGPDLATAFGLDSTVFGGERMAVTGELGTNGLLGGGGDTRLQASFHSADPANAGRLMLAMRQVSIPGLPALPSLRVASLNYANAINWGHRLRIQYGSMVNALTMTDTVASFDPYLRARFELGPQSSLEYRVASAVPPLHFNRDYADMPDPVPQVSLDHNRARLEHARHQELRYSDSLTANDSVSVAVFDDQFQRTAINGAYSLNGQAPAAADVSQNGTLLPDLLNNMFIANGGNYGGWGYRIVFDRRLGDHWKADFGYAEGSVLAPRGASWSGDLAASLGPARAHAWTIKLAGVTPLTHTNLVCSYRALSRPAATALDPYDDGSGQSDSYANLYLRQPLPSFFGGGNGRVAALIEIHNLLAQGYIPMLGSDGHTLYLVQTARSLRGGVTINF
ncbi:MAG TPA: carboxypeptidase-like regulatory domain-containing protein [Terriglobales bacterium]|nr:carboxypeptidase-like regulatory domain-containing protein [Terriglobales bacterium]